MAPVPESVRRSIRTSRAWSRNTLLCAASSAIRRSSMVFCRIGSTVLMRNGSMIVWNFMLSCSCKGKPVRFTWARGPCNGPRSRLEACLEEPQVLGLESHSETCYLMAHSTQFDDAFSHHVHVCLRVDAAWNRK